MTKRKQVKNACVNCQKACKKCDDMRPCERCTKYGLEATCRDSARKERKKGIRRGPYSRIVEDGETDDSDTTCWSDETRARTIGKSPGSDSYNNTSPEGSGKYWQGHIMLSRVNKAENHLKAVDRQSSYERFSLHVGAPDSTYIKALSMVCSEVLKKIEEDTMPPAVTVKSHPQHDDLFFQSVSFSSASNSSNPQITPHELLMAPAPLRQPVPLPFNGKSGLLVHEPTSSPIHTEPRHLFLNQSFEIMTPPETPLANFEDSKRLQEDIILKLPPIGDILHPEHL